MAISSDILVIGRYLPTFYYSGFGGGVAGTVGGGSLYSDVMTADYPETSEGGASGGNDPENLPPKVRDDSGYVSDELFDQFRRAIISVDTKIANANASLTVSTSDGKIIDLGEIYSKWLNLDFIVTHGGDYGANSSGAQYGGGDQPAVTKIDDKGFAGYGAWANNVGFNFLLLHELAHQSEASTDYLRRTYNHWFEENSDKSDAAWKTSQSFVKTEQYTNRIAEALAGILDIPIMSEVPLGYGS